jgi:hypothetical protein
MMGHLFYKVLLSAFQLVSTSPGFAGRFVSTSARQPGVAQAKAEMLTSDSRRLERAD